MLIVMNMENGEINRDPVATEAESYLQSLVAPPALYPAQRIPQPQLQEISLPPRAACPPPSLCLINVTLSTFDA